MIRTYNEYLKLLEDAVIGNGKSGLSDYQIEQFIKSNHLDSDWHIVLSEVKKDMATILKKYQNPVDVCIFLVYNINDVRNRMILIHN